MAALSERTRRRPLNPGVIVDDQNPPRRHVRALEALSHFSGELARDDVRAPVGAPEPCYSSSLAVPPPVAPLALLGLGPGRALLFGALAARAGLRWGAHPGPGAEAPGPKPPGARGRTEVAGRTAWTSPWARSSAEAAGTPGTARWAAGPGSRWPRAAEAATSRAWRARAETAGRTRPRRFGLRLLDDDRTPLQDAAGKLLDRSLGAVVGRGFDEGEPAWTTCFAIERDANAAQLDAVPR